MLCVFLLESPHGGDSNEYTQYTNLIQKRKSLYIIPNQELWGFSRGLKNEFERAVVNEPSVYELKVDCILIWSKNKNLHKMLKMQQIFPKLYRCLLYVVFHNLGPQNAGLVGVKKDLN